MLMLPMITANSRLCFKVKRNRSDSLLNEIIFAVAWPLMRRAASQPEEARTAMQGHIDFVRMRVTSEA